MDIGKYIGRFLLKNKYCSLPGLGVFELKKEPARPNAGNETMLPPAYKITFTPVGSIDDTFASFIASSENVSISNASNNIRDYCKQVKEELAGNGKFVIEHLGHFSMSNQQIVFQQSADLDLGMEPVPLPPLVDKTKSPEAMAAKADYSYPPVKSRKPFPLVRVLLIVFTLCLVVAGVYFGYHYYQTNQEENTLDESPVLNENLSADTMTTVIDTASVARPDSLAVPGDSVSGTDTVMSQPAPVTPAPASGYNVAVISYNSESAAQSKAMQLKRYGNQTSVVNRDGRFIVAIQAANPVSDTSKLVDSLRRFYNPKGPVYILK